MTNSCAARRYFDDLDLPLTFEYPKAWVRRKNTLRPGVIIADFSTADKVGRRPLELLAAKLSTLLSREEAGSACAVVCCQLSALARALGTAAAPRAWSSLPMSWPLQPAARWRIGEPLCLLPAGFSGGVS